MKNDKVSDPVYKSDFGRTICEVHRELYDILFLELENSKYREMVLDKLQESYIYAKKMDAKLRQYKNDYDVEWWQRESAKVVQEKLELRKKRER